MQAEEYNRRGKEMVDYITRYLTTIRERKVTPGPEVKPGYMRELLPDSAPTDPEDWDCIFGDIEKVIMPGVVHWQSPYMHAYYPALTSWPSMLGDMLADAINNIGFTWASSPACTELEMNVMDWLCKALGLPTFFLHHHPESTGGGILQSTVSESSLVALLAARKARIQQLKRTDPADRDLDDSVVNSRLVAYASDQAHSSVEKAGLISLVKIRFLPPDDHFSLRGDTLKQAIQEDRRRGLVPVMLCATLGTTGVCAFDDLSELGPVCAEEGLWLHVDAAYAGSAFLCPELRGPLGGIEYADSFTFNPSKWMMVHFDCTAFWVKDKVKLQQTFSVDPVYLRHENSDQATDFMGVEMAKLLESLVRCDPNFDMPADRHLGLVVFCLKEGNALTQELLRRLTRSRTMYLVPADIDGKRIIRFTVTSQLTTSEDIIRDWDIIRKMAADLLAEAAEKQAVSKMEEQQSPVRKTVEKLSETNSDSGNHTTTAAEGLAASLMTRKPKEIEKAISDTEDEPLKTPKELETGQTQTSPNTGSKELEVGPTQTSPKTGSKELEADPTQASPETGSKELEADPTQTSPKTGPRELGTSLAQTSPKTGPRELGTSLAQTSPKTGPRELGTSLAQTSPKTGPRELGTSLAQTSPKTGPRELGTSLAQTSPKTGPRELGTSLAQTSPKTGPRELGTSLAQTSPKTGPRELGTSLAQTSPKTGPRELGTSLAQTSPKTGPRELGTSLAQTSPKTGPRELGTSLAQTSQDPEKGARDGPEEVPCTAAFRVQRVQPQLRLDSDKTGFRPQPPFWMDKEKSGSENRPRRTVRSLSCSSEPLPGPIGPLFGHNTDPLSKPLSSSVTDSQPGHKDPDLIHPLNDTQLRRLSSSPSPSGLFQIPEWPSPTNSNQLGKRVLRKLTKFYSLPSFCHLWVQCGHYQVCCPVRGLQIAPKLRSPQNPGPPLGVGDSAVGLVPL
uniref:histidine decarboxylase-like n=2 Tax=Oncorhynchus gorbuscha TaxID=8017 RepID=UPI001EAF73D5|nr:histidine decarboxylase-like [Oncorhynchus gorbuscha]